MIHFDLPQEKSNIIKVMGFGGGGGNAVNFMYVQDIQNVDFVVCNTDAQALQMSPVPNKVQLGPALTHGLGAGANPSVGKEATQESLDEIRKMLEVNTKMVFITAGMGGGTGTGGAPIVAQICREMGILTVGIVTTPFTHEGPRRMAQAKAGVEELKKHVDTLLVISNDKIRHQYGNLRWKEAFNKADDVLCTAARCITDIINNTGLINVDFADVCTVMRDGGVAILGNATASGENRALKAIEAAANSPLLNDSDIKGAKWILINITSADGDHQCTVDEIEEIQQYLHEQTGGNVDVILGLGQDDSLGDAIGITLIATGFHHQNPFEKPKPKAEAAPPPIIMTLGVAGEEKKMETPMAKAPEPPEPVQRLMPLLGIQDIGLINSETLPTQAGLDIQPELRPVLEEDEDTAVDPNDEQPVVFELSIDAPVQSIDTQIVEVSMPKADSPSEAQPQPVQRELFDFLNKPATIYVQPAAAATPPPAEVPTAPPVPPAPPVVEPVLQFDLHEEDDNEPQEDALQLSIEETPLYAPEPAQPAHRTIADEGYQQELSEEELNKQRAQERMKRLRGLSFTQTDTQAMDDTPAYVRQKMELHNSLANVEDFYSRATVRGDDKQQGAIHTLNNFLHGNKPD